MLPLVRRVGIFLYVLCNVTVAIKTISVSGRSQVLMLSGNSVFHTCQAMNILFFSL